MKRTIVAALLLVSFCLAPSGARANNLDQELQSDYVGKMLTFRQFYSSDRLRFDSDGKILSDPDTGPWTLYGKIEVEKARLEHGALRLTGRRVQIMFDSGKQVDELISIQNNDDKHSKDLAKELRKLKVEIEIQLPSGEPDQKEIYSAIHNVFLTDSESLADFVPSYWRSYFFKSDGRRDDAMKSSAPLYKVGSGVSAPRAIHQPDPSYAEEARKAKFQGTLVLWLVVSSEGTPKNIRVLKPLGLGLDEKAVESVSQWRFDPGTKDGEPVATMVNVEVTFHLY
jgi:TonB family protein